MTTIGTIIVAIIGFLGIWYVQKSKNKREKSKSRYSAFEKAMEPPLTPEKERYIEYFYKTELKIKKRKIKNYEKIINKQEKYRTILKEVDLYSVLEDYAKNFESEGENYEKL